MSRKRYSRDTVYYGHGIAGPLDAPAQSAERVTNVSPRDLDDFLTVLGSDGTITFDDGYLDNLTTALPILEKHGRRATIFATCGFIDDSCPPLERVAGSAARAGERATRPLAALGIDSTDPDTRYEQILQRLKPLSVAERHACLHTLTSACVDDSRALTADYLNVAQLAELSRHPLITVGAHTLTHPDLRFATDDELVAELIDARTLIESWIDQPVDELAYPYGDTNQRVRRVAAAGGYHRGYVVEQANWRSRLPAYGRLDIPRVDLSTATRRMRKHERKAEAAKNTR